ncbi:gamma-glutamyl-gamma-aminobutyrate hydrolase family protein [Rhizobium mesoamericanum]|uniref:Peptidase C26 n=1 Tax=Rhizobium mesoamericanum STM3625 TaxID=1211777 RepID=K0Q554_9HYPH|nr:gamma-glutamyl-gamma-aminobutyrate hydrolase family protein [Rhizobium mesoamericanum]CCM79842.1 Peptidase C26 [Rhizobium mesoamericanum STM3625]
MVKTPRRPAIGITPDMNDVAAPETEYVLRRNYADAVYQMGGIPFILPYAPDVDAYLESADGVLITGGMFDIDPALYRQQARKAYAMKPPRTAFEKALIEGALQRHMPVLGICNGMQLLAVCLGGQLVQDIPSELANALEHKPGQAATIAHHEISIVSQSRNLIGVEAARYPVNSVHHQAVLPSEAYRTIAAADDGVIEAIESSDGGFAMGVQWHPEYGVSNIDSVVWRGFISAASEYSSKRAWK